MKKFLEKNLIIIITCIMLIIMVGNCAQNREITAIKQGISAIKDSTFTKQQESEITLLLTSLYSKYTEREGLESELRFYQSTDRKLMDVERQSTVVELIKKLDEEIKDLEMKLYETLD
jgi:hypothetical protein